MQQGLKRSEQVAPIKPRVKPIHKRQQAQETSGWWLTKVRLLQSCPKKFQTRLSFSPQPRPHGAPGTEAAFWFVVIASTAAGLHTVRPWSDATRQQHLS